MANRRQQQQAAIFGFALTLASEVIGMSKLKENSLLQLILGLMRRQCRDDYSCSDSFSSSSYRKSGITQSGKEGSWSTARVNFCPLLTKKGFKIVSVEGHPDEVANQ